MIQETLLNLLLRNYLHYNLYDQAEKLRSKAPRFEAHSNQQVNAMTLIPLFIIVNTGHSIMLTIGQECDCGQIQSTLL